MNSITHDDAERMRREFKTFIKKICRKMDLAQNRTFWMPPLKRKRTRIDFEARWAGGGATLSLKTKPAGPGTESERLLSEK